MNGDADDASFTRYSHLSSQVVCYTTGDLTGGNMALSSTAHQKADRGSAILAANGPDRRVGGIGPKSALEPKCPDSAHAPTGTVRGQDDRFSIGLLMSCIVEDDVSACQVASGAAVDP